jgi:hypothetical protein
MEIKYRKIYPQVSFRIFGMGKGVPTYIMQYVRKEPEHKIVIEQLERENKINDLLKKYTK